MIAPSTCRSRPLSCERLSSRRHGDRPSRALATTRCERHARTVRHDDRLHGGSVDSPAKCCCGEETMAYVPPSGWIEWHGVAPTPRRHTSSSPRSIVEDHESRVAGVRTGCRRARMVRPPLKEVWHQGTLRQRSSANGRSGTFEQSMVSLRMASLRSQGTATPGWQSGDWARAQQTPPDNCGWGAKLGGCLPCRAI